MTQSETLWHPENSVTLQSDESEECGRGSLVLANCSSNKDSPAEYRTKKSHKIIRRTPTFDVSAMTSSKEGDRVPLKYTKPSEKQSYQTMEARTEQSLLDYSLKVLRKQESASSNCTDLCGWQENEPLSGKSSFSGTAMERFQTPDGQRSTLHSRAGSSRNSSRYGRRQNRYEFKHLTDAHEYMDHYRKMYCYTTLTVPLQGECRFVEEEVTQEAENFMPIGVRSLYRGDPYLKELAMRLGVRESIREQQLLQPPRKTPPSIVKKNSSHSDLYVCTKREEEDSIQNEKPSDETFKKDSPNLSRAVEPLELPRIAQSTQICSANKSGSTISVNKYLQVSSPKQEGEDKRGTPPPTVATQSSVTKNTSASTLSEDIHFEVAENDSQQQKQRETKEPEDFVGGDEIKFPPWSTNPPQDQLFTRDSAQREKLISQKAQALGLISRDWAKAPNTKKLFGNHTQPMETGYRYPRPSTRGASGDATSKDNAGNENPTKGDEKKEPHRSKPAVRLWQVDNTQKLEKLKSIYEPLRKSNSINHASRSSSEKSHNAKCERKSLSRPVTRFSSGAELHDFKYKASYSYSRPITRLEKSEARISRAKLKDTELQCLEESNYWNELPQTKTQQQPSKNKQKQTATHIDEAAIFAQVDITSLRNPSPSRKQGRWERGHHTVALSMRMKRPPLLLQQSNSGIAEPIPPGSGPKQIMEHLTKMRKKLDGVLGIQLAHS